MNLCKMNLSTRHRLPNPAWSPTTILSFTLRSLSCSCVEILDNAIFEQLLIQFIMKKMNEIDKWPTKLLRILRTVENNMIKAWTTPILLLKKTIIASMKKTGWLEFKLSSLLGRSEEKDPLGLSIRYQVRIWVIFIALAGGSQYLTFPKSLIWELSKLLLRVCV